MERSGILGLKNVEILSAQLSRNSAKMVTFGTLTEALKIAFPAISEGDLADTLDYIVQFLDALHDVRPAELSLLSVAHRQSVRDKSVADQAVLWHGYFHLAGWLRKNAPDTWREDLRALAEPVTYQHNGKTFNGDLFSRENPVWIESGVMAPPAKRGCGWSTTVRPARQRLISSKRWCLAKSWVPLSLPRNRQSKTACSNCSCRRGYS